MAFSLQAALKSQKKSLRNSLGTSLNQLSSANIEQQSQKIMNHVLSLPTFQRCQSISCYLSMPSGEVSTDMLVEAILQSDKKLFVPRIQTMNGTMDFLRVYSLNDLASFPSGTWGIKEPPESWEGQKRDEVLGLAMESLDLIILPGVAFDRGLSRLGHGKGYYDRFIASYVSSARPKPLLVGLSLREQLLDHGQVPVGEHDWKLDLLVTPDEIIGPHWEDQGEM
ncbi:5-formyltetrahydrofolate cyclo-ligase [Gymnopilus junonius]|uniref:5-formyltetrahydrofolate cyclo-ligase n=1 Tax=Gymnopilus junonius TaxID=109634 RepID=A0A9P5NSV0_GYMJU|nr:5-formyltetrahydrofolate cyclo-ligase [Gymnopilus junonius]